jgi:histidyl-tRNA synthetase
VLIGEEERKSGEPTLKNMQTGEQENVTVDELIRRIHQ